MAPSLGRVILIWLLTPCIKRLKKTANGLWRSEKKAPVSSFEQCFVEVGPVVSLEEGGIHLGMKVAMFLDSDDGFVEGYGSGGEGKVFTKVYCIFADEFLECFIVELCFLGMHGVALPDESMTLCHDRGYSGFHLEPLRNQVSFTNFDWQLNDFMNVPKYYKLS